MDSWTGEAEFYLRSSERLYHAVVLPNGNVYKMETVSPSMEACGTPWLTMALCRALLH